MDFIIQLKALKSSWIISQLQLENKLIIFIEANVVMTIIHGNKKLIIYYDGQIGDFYINNWQ